MVNFDRINSLTFDRSTHTKSSVNYEGKWGGEGGGRLERSKRIISLYVKKNKISGFFRRYIFILFFLLFFYFFNLVIFLI